VIEGGEAYRFLEAMASFLKTAFDKVEYPQVVPGLWSAVIPAKGGMIALFGPFKSLEFVVDKPHGYPGVGQAVVDINRPLEAGKGLFIITGPLLGYTQIKPKKGIFGLYN
jgi:hypothetical protein